MLTGNWGKLKMAAVLAGLALGLALFPGRAPAGEPENGAAPASAGPSAGSDDIEALAQEYQAIVKAIRLFLAGAGQGSSEVMKEAFLPGANVYGVVDGRLTGGPVQEFYDLVDSRPPAGEIPHAIVRLEAMENVAMVRVDIDDWAGAKYCDLFTLVKVDGGWKIASRVSHQF